MTETTAGLLLRYVGEVVSPVVQLVIIAGFGGLTVSRYRHLPDAYDFAVALIRFLQRILTPHLHGYAGGSRIALHRRVGAIQLRGVRLAGWIGHGYLVTTDLVRPDGGI